MLTTREVATLVGCGQTVVQQMALMNDVRPDLVYRGSRGAWWSPANAFAVLVSAALHNLGVDRRSRHVVYEMLRGTSAEGLEAMTADGRHYLLALPPRVSPRLVTADDLTPPDELATDALRMLQARGALIDVRAGLRAATERIGEIIAARPAEAPEAGHARYASAR